MELDYMESDFLEDILRGPDLGNTRDLLSTRLSDVGSKLLDPNQITFDDLDFSEDFWKDFLLEEEPQSLNRPNSFDASDHTYDGDISLSPGSEGSERHFSSSPESMESHLESANEEPLIAIPNVQYSVLLDNISPGEIGAQEVVLTSEDAIAEDILLGNTEEDDSSNDDTSCETISGIYAEMNYCKVQKFKLHTQSVRLTDEEKTLMRKEGISVPTHLPLTKQEERDLKRIRRKIRNKQSAQDSRKRKKEYMDGLENRVRVCTAQNAVFQKKIKILEKQNSDLMTQLKQLKAILTTSSLKPTQTSTYVMVLVLSFALLIMPSFKPASWNQDNVPSLGIKNTPVPGHSRNLLFVMEPESADRQESVQTVEDKVNDSLIWNLDFLQKEVSKLTEIKSKDASKDTTEKAVVFRVAENH